MYVGGVSIECPGSKWFDEGTLGKAEGEFLGSLSEVGVLSSLVGAFFISGIWELIWRVEIGAVEALDNELFLGVGPSDEGMPVETVRGSTMVDFLRLSPLKSPLEKLLVVLGFGGSFAIVALAFDLCTRFSAIDPLPRIILALDELTEVFASSSMFTRLPLDRLSLDDDEPTRPWEGLGIMEPAVLEAIGAGMFVDLDVVDMYMGGKIVGAGFALGGSIAESVFPRFLVVLWVLGADEKIEVLSLAPETITPTSFILPT